MSELAIGRATASSLFDESLFFERLIRDLFATMNAVDLPYLVLRNYECFPQRPEKPDIGLLIAPRATEGLHRVVAAVCRSHGCACIRAPRSNGVVVTAIVQWIDDCGEVAESRLKIDARTYESFKFTQFQKRVPYFSHKVFFEDVARVRVVQHECAFYVYENRDQLVSYFRQWRRKQDLRYRDCIRALLNDSEVRKWFSSSTDMTNPQKLFEATAYREEFDRIAARLLTARWGVYTVFRAAISHLRVLTIVLRLQRLLPPLIYVSGSDGCGKTALLRTLRESFSDSEVKQIYSLKRVLNFFSKRVYAVCRRLRSREENGVLSQEERWKRNHVFAAGGSRVRHALNVMHLAWTVLDFWISWLYTVPFRFWGAVVLVETAPYDLFVKYGMPEYPWLERLLAPAIPKPALGFLLTADAATICKRKNELSEDEIVTFYLRLSRTLTRGDARRYYVDLSTEFTLPVTAAMAESLLSHFAGKRENRG